MRFATFATAALLVFAAASAGAQPASTARADALFTEGRALLEAGKYEEACAKFAASLAEADALGTRLNLALCMEKRGKLYTAVIKYEDAFARAERSGQTDSARVAKEHAEALRPRIPTLKITVRQPVPDERLVVRVPGAPDREVDPANPVPVDPTDPNDPSDVITVVASAPGFASYSSPPITILESGKRKTVEIPALVAGSADEHAPVVTTPAPRSRRRLYGIVLASAGVAADAAATLWAIRASDAAGKNCRDATGALDTGCGAFLQLRYGATSLFAVGLGAAALGIYWIATPHKGERTAVVPAIGPDGGGVTLLGQF